MTKINILGVKISNITKQAALEEVGQFLSDDNQHIITTPNPEMIVLAQKDGEFRNALNEADLAIPDGYGLILASYILKNPLRQRVHGVDFMMDVIRLAEQKIQKVYFLGGGPKVAAEMSMRIKNRFVNLKIVGANDGGKIDQRGVGENDWQTIELINQSQPDILFVAFGQCKQEKWVVRNLKRMPSVKIIMVVGGSFDFIAGKVKRAPNILRRLCLEWVWRLILEPWRIKRIYNAVIKFPWLVLKYRLKRREVNGE